GQRHVELVLARRQRIAGLRGGERGEVVRLVRGGGIAAADQAVLRHEVMRVGVVEQGDRRGVRILVRARRYRVVEQLCLHEAAAAGVDGEAQHVGGDRDQRRGRGRAGGVADRRRRGGAAGLGVRHAGRAGRVRDAAAGGGRRRRRQVVLLPSHEQEVGHGEQGEQEKIAGLV